MNTLRFVWERLELKIAVHEITPFITILKSFDIGIFVLLWRFVWILAVLLFKITQYKNQNIKYSKIYYVSETSYELVSKN